MKPDELIAYFNEHVLYEIDMLRGTHERFQNCQDDVTRNALLESFGMHARNLSDFLRNKSAGGRNTVLASQFNTQFRHQRPSDANGAFQRLNSGMHHLGTDRAKGQKFSLKDATDILRWIDRDFQRFLDDLPEPYKSGICQEALPAYSTAATIADSPTTLTTTNTTSVGTGVVARSRPS